MAAAKKDGLELNEDRPFQEKVWTVQRGAWIAMALIVLVALAGLTGQGGPLSMATVSGPEGSIDYPRISRWQADDSFKLNLAPRSGSEATVDIDIGFGEIFEINDIQPEPDKSSVTSNGQRLTFKLDGAPGPRQVTIYVRALRPSFGRSLSLSLNDGRPMNVTPVVLP